MRGPGTRPGEPWQASTPVLPAAATTVAPRLMISLDGRVQDVTGRDAQGHGDDGRELQVLLDPREPVQDVGLGAAAPAVGDAHGDDRGSLGDAVVEARGGRGAFPCRAWWQRQQQAAAAAAAASSSAAAGSSGSSSIIISSSISGSSSSSGGGHSRSDRNEPMGVPGSCCRVVS